MGESERGPGGVWRRLESSRASAEAGGGRGWLCAPHAAASPPSRGGRQQRGCGGGLGQMAGPPAGPARWAARVRPGTNSLSLSFIFIFYFL